MTSETASEWGLYRNRADHSITYTARLTNDGERYRIRGRELGVEDFTVSREFFENVYEAYEEGDDE